MANKNYNKMSKTKTELKTEPVEKVVETAEVVEEVIEQTVEEPVVTTVKGVVTDCVRLNVRKAPVKTADVLFTINADTVVVIDTAKSTDGWYQVTTSEGDGFCMKDYIKV